MNLFERLRHRTATVGVIGLGYACPERSRRVGLPLAVEFARAGFPTIGIDIDGERFQQIQASQSYIPDVSDDAVAPLVRSGRLTATTDYSLLKEVDTVSICVPTPLGKTKDPDNSYILAAADGAAAYAHRDQLIVLESTTYPGTTEEILLPKLITNGFVGEDLYVAYSPERIDPGKLRRVI